MKKPGNIKILTLGDGLKTGSYDFYAGFKSVDNFVNSKGDLISLSDNQSLLASNTIIVNRFLPGKARYVEIFDNQVKFNNTLVSTEETKTYCSELDFKNISRNEAVQIIYSFINYNKQCFPDDSLIQLLSDNHAVATSDTVIKATSSFERALWIHFRRAFSDFENDFYTCIRLFKGKGSGLTPSGDDFIAGVLYGMHFLEVTEGKSLKDVKQKIYKIATGKNLFSNNMLIMSLNAQYFKRLKDFLSALFHPGLYGTKEAFQQLISTGHTSGADLLAGFFSVVLYYRPVKITI